MGPVAKGCPVAQAGAGWILPCGFDRGDGRLEWYGIDTCRSGREGALPAEGPQRERQFDNVDP